MTYSLRAAAERTPAIILLLACASGISFLLLLVLYLANVIADSSSSHRVDMWILHAAWQLRQSVPWVADVMRDLSGLGSTVVLALSTVGAAAYLVLTGFRQAGVIILGSVLTATMTMALMKQAFGRARPDSELAHFVAHGLSFPSGHSSMSAVVFLTLGALLAHAHARVRERWFILLFAMLLAMLVGISRAMLGVHWLTDVLGGWALGSAWAAATVWLVSRQERRAA